MFSEALDSMSMTVTVGGDEHEARLKPGDLVRFERHFKTPITGLINADGTMNMGLDQLAFLAYSSLTRTGAYDGDYDGFVDQLDDIDLEGESVDPTSPTASSG